MYTKDSCVSISFEKFLHFGKKTLSKDLEVAKNSRMLRSQLYSCMKRKDLQASSQYICILSTDAVISEVDTIFGAGEFNLFSCSLNYSGISCLDFDNWHIDLIFILCFIFFEDFILRNLPFWSLMAARSRFWARLWVVVSMDQSPQRLHVGHIISVFLDFQPLRENSHPQEFQKEAVSPRSLDMARV